MKDVYINGITKDSPFDDEMFLEILETDDLINKTKYIEDVRRACKKVGRVKEFDNLLRAWTKRASQLNNQDNTGGVTSFTGAPLTLRCGKYTATDAGVDVWETAQSGEQYRLVACPHPILPSGRLINIDTDTEKVKVAFRRDGRWRDITVDCNTVLNRQHICQLADRGVFVTSETSKELVKYMSECISLNAETIPLYRSISRLGWVGDDFAPYVQDIQYDGDSDFQGIYEHVCECGEYQTWLDHVGELRQDINIRLMLDASFASVLIEKIGGLPFVLHLWGTTGFGKTVSLMVASSIWGDPEMGRLTRTMNMTANAMAKTSAFLYSIPFCADELQQMKSRWGNYDDLIMYLSEGIDRGRAKAHGGVEITKIWRNSFLFTGEEPVTKASSGGGVKNRCIEVEVKDKIIPDGNQTANLVKANYGHAGRKFVEYVQGLDVEAVKGRYKEIFTAIIEECETTEKQAMAMAMILLADEYSSHAIFDDLSPLDVKQVSEYLVSAKTVEMTERAYDWVVNWIAENQIRFNASTDENRGAIWGKIEDGVAWVNKNVLTKAMHDEGFDCSACSRKWGDSGKIIKNSQDRYVHQTAVCNIRASYIKIVIDDMAGFIEVDDDEPMPFE